MPKNGYTIVELLVVITIIGLLSVSAIVYSRSLSQDQPLIKAANNIKSLLITAQTNATSGFDCGTSRGATNWSVQFSSDNNKKNIYLRCDQSGSVIKTFTLEDKVRLDSGSTECSPELPVKISYSALSGKVSFSSGDDDDPITNCYDITIKLKADSGIFKTITITNGGSINVL